MAAAAAAAAGRRVGTNLREQPQHAEGELASPRGSRSRCWHEQERAAARPAPAPVGVGRARRERLERAAMKLVKCALRRPPLVCWGGEGYCDAPTPDPPAHRGRLNLHLAQVSNEAEQRDRDDRAQERHRRCRHDHRYPSPSPPLPALSDAAWVLMCGSVFGTRRRGGGGGTEPRLTPWSASRCRY
jgi:hypothetical protein